jgi:putative membrane protein
VAQAGQALGVQQTDEPSPDGQQLMTRLQGLSGAEFDRAFAQGMVESHRKTIAMYEQQEQAGGPEQVTALVRQSLPVLRKHLEQAEKLANAK